MSDVITSNVLRTKVSVFDIGVEPKPVGTSFLPDEWSDCICPIHNMSLKLASNISVDVKFKVFLFVQLEYLPIRVRFDVMQVSL